MQAPDVGSIRRFPARIDALHKAELAFRVPGTVRKLAVKERDRVKKEQTLATLDPTDYKIAAKNAQASFDRAKKDFKRAKELVKKGFISRSDYDAKEAVWKNAQMVSRFEIRWENQVIGGRDRMQTIIASANPKGPLAAPLFARLRPQIEAIELPPDDSLTWGGEYRIRPTPRAPCSASCPPPSWP